MIDAKVTLHNNAIDGRLFDYLMKKHVADKTMKDFIRFWESQPGCSCEGCNQFKEIKRGVKNEKH